MFFQLRSGAMDGFLVTDCWFLQIQIQWHGVQFFDIVLHNLTIEFVIDIIAYGLCSCSVEEDINSMLVGEVIKRIDFLVK